MDGLADMVRSAAEDLARIENERDTAMAVSRRVIRLSKRVIHSIHVGDDASTDEMRASVEELLSTDAPEVRLSQMVQDALMEYAEAAILRSLVIDGRIPSPTELGIPSAAWVLGLCDCVGELRRIVTSHLMEGDMDGARRYFSMMEDISGEIMLLDVPDAVAPVRRKQDIARGIMDRTRSDMTTAAVVGRL